MLQENMKSCLETFISALISNPLMLSLRPPTQHLSFCHVHKHIVNSGITEVKELLKELFISLSPKTTNDIHTLITVVQRCCL